jgi:hypothetical protein
MPTARRTDAETVRREAARLAARRPHPRHVHNNEEHEYRDHSGPGASCPVSHIANYTKGLPHDPKTGLLLNPVDYKLFLTGIQTGDPSDFKNTPLGPATPPATLNSPSVEQITPASDESDRKKVWESKVAGGVEVRAWESAGAGNVFDLEGPDAQAVTMPPAPRFDSDELLAEIAEVYAMALLRDLPFRQFPLPAAATAKNGDAPSRPDDDTTALGDCVDLDAFGAATEFLCALPWFNGSELEASLDAHAASRRRRLQADGTNLFRGTTPGEQVGPYLSQFLLIGNTALGGDVRLPKDGFIQYGALGIQQKVRVATPCKDYLTVWEPFIDVQNGADLRGQETYAETGNDTNPNTDGFRFITTPRDLATYVHYDALYEAYVNACIFLLASGAPFDRGIPFLEADAYDKQQGFAHFGGPHILTLVAEVATRALKAVRYQKFNVHRRLRPEAMGGLYDRGQNHSSLLHGALAPFKPISEGLDALSWGEDAFPDVLSAHNRRNNDAHFSNEGSAKKKSYLLPMAFPEGSPMHPSYGAGHATVAGACVTILKAYFDHGWTPPEFYDDSGRPVAYEPSNDGSTLLATELSAPLTVEGELNKLAANISIGRNWAGVHYYSDYIESIRMGEEIAIGLLEEQKLTYPENFSMTVPLYDGGAVRV